MATLKSKWEESNAGLRNSRVVIYNHATEIVYECPEENVPEAMEIIKYLMEHPFGDKPEQQVTYLQANGGIGDSYQEAK